MMMHHVCLMAQVLVVMFILWVQNLKAINYSTLKQLVSKIFNVSLILDPSAWNYWNSICIWWLKTNTMLPSLKIINNNCLCFSFKTGPTFWSYGSCKWWIHSIIIERLCRQICCVLLLSIGFVSQSKINIYPTHLDTNKQTISFINLISAHLYAQPKFWPSPTVSMSSKRLMPRLLVCQLIVILHIWLGSIHHVKKWVYEIRSYQNII